HRVGASYNLMTSHIDEEDLLHVVNTPPEIYIAESDGLSSVINQKTNNNLNYEKVEIINNLMNRIVMSADVDLTYQDRVFITDALYKLGIRDDRKFMSRVYKLINENRDKEKIVNMVLNGDVYETTVKELLTEITSNSSKRTENTFINVDENRLYNEIFERLQTGAVYQIVSNFNHTSENNEISADEYSMSEQSNTATNMFIEQIANELSVSGANMIYNYENNYEEEIRNGDVVYNKEENAVTATIFLDMIKNLYQLAHDKTGSVNNSYFDFRSTIYKAADNSILRLKNDFYSDVRNITDNRVYNENYSKEYNKADVTYDVTGNIDVTEDISNTTSIESDQRRQQYASFIQNVENRMNEKHYENIDQSSEVNDAEIVNVSENEDTTVENNELLEVLNRINIENEERRQQYTMLIREIEARHKKPKHLNGKKETIKNGIVALNDGQQIIDKLADEEEQALAEQKEIRREIERIFPDNARKIFEIVSDYYENNTEVLGNMTESNISLLINNIEQVRRENENIQNINMNIQNEKNAAVDTVHRILESKTYNTVNKQENEASKLPDAEIVHRQNERVTSEDIEETLNEYRRNISKQIKEEVKEETENIHSAHTNRVVNHYNTMNQDFELPNISKLVQDGVNAQIGTISDKVYSRLERKMATEKSRRGY
nr:hypothetical protein [Butyrivibrio sp.]